jgi:hypothetical protein
VSFHFFYVVSFGRNDGMYVWTVDVLYRCLNLYFFICEQGWLIYDCDLSVVG